MSQEIRIQPSDPEAARAQIERTRARMSETLDQIEDVLLVKKARIKEQLDIVARIREKPLHAAGIVFGAGLLLGLLTGGGDDAEEEIEARLEAEARAELWERRARRLLSIARAQEEEIEELEARPLKRPIVVSREPIDARDPEGASARVRELRGEVIERVTGSLSDAADRLVAEFRKRL